MARRKTREPQPANPALRDEAPIPALPIRCRRGRVLLAAYDEGLRAALRRTLAGSDFECEFVSTFAQACDAVATASFDVAVIDAGLPDAPGLELLRRLGVVAPDTRIVFTTASASVETAVDAMRLGASDMLTMPLNEPEALAAVHVAMEQSRLSRAKARKIERLERVCRRLNAARRHVHTQVDALCNDLAGAYQELADQVTQMSLASEFSAIIQQELDIEELLRKVLEYMLTKSGPTNAAIYLPSNHSDFSLGAYVNYNCPRDAADLLLEHLADVLPARFQDEPRARVFATAQELALAIDDQAGWIEDSAAMVLSCRNDDECLAVLVLFRDQSRPFPPELVQQVETMGGLFARQLARVIRVHHRQLETDEGWEMDDDAGLGGMAA